MDKPRIMQMTRCPTSENHDGPTFGSHLLLLLRPFLLPLLRGWLVLTRKKVPTELSSAYFTCHECNSRATTTAACYLPVFLGSTNSRKLSFTLGKYPSTRTHSPHGTGRLNSRGARERERASLFIFICGFIGIAFIFFCPNGFQF